MQLVTRRLGTGCHGFGFCGGDNFTSLCCALCVCLCVDLLKKKKKRKGESVVIRWERLDSGLLSGAPSVRLAETPGGRFLFITLSAKSRRECASTWSAFFHPHFFLIPLQRKTVTKQIPDHISRNKPYHG